MVTDVPRGIELLCLKREERLNQLATQEPSDLRSQIGMLFARWTSSYCFKSGSKVTQHSVHFEPASPRGQYYALLKLHSDQPSLIT